MMKKTRILLSCICSCLLTACQSSTSVKENRDEELQTILQEKLESRLDELGAESGLVLIMESSTGELKTSVDIQRTDSGLFAEGRLKEESSEIRLVKMPVLLALLESASVTDSTLVDTGEGIAVVAGDTIRDLNWKSGGYGEIPVSRVLTTSSDIGLAKAVEGNLDAVNNALSAMGIALNLVSEPENWIGYNHFITPVEILTIYNNIVSGKVKSNKVDAIKGYMLDCVENGVAKKTLSDKVRIAAIPSTTQDANDDQLYRMHVCGFFPYDTPQYTIMVCIHKRGLPVSAGSMCCPLVKEIAELFTN